MTNKYELPTNEQELAKEFEKLGRAFFDKSKAKTFEGAYNILNRVPIFQSKYKNNKKR